MGVYEHKVGPYTLSFLRDFFAPNGPDYMVWALRLQIFEVVILSYTTLTLRTGKKRRLFKTNVLWQDFLGLAMLV